jgi:hypothetical protein
MNTLRLGGIELNSQMVWSDRHTSQAVAQAVLRTLGGAPVVFSQQLVAGQSITLEARQDRGWIRGSVLQELIALANVAGNIMELQVNTLSIQVMFRHHEAPALDFEPITPRLNEGNNDIYTGTIKLITV